jgi:hypothetical protein
MCKIRRSRAARLLRPPRLQRVLLDALRHVAHATFIDTPPREQRLVVLQHQHIPARADLRASRSSQDCTRPVTGSRSRQTSSPGWR